MQHWRLKLSKRRKIRKRKHPPGINRHTHTIVSVSVNFEHALLFHFFEWVDSRGRTSDSCHCHLNKQLGQEAADEMRQEDEV